MSPGRRIHESFLALRRTIEDGLRASRGADRIQGRDEGAGTEAISVEDLTFDRLGRAPDDGGAGCGEARTGAPGKDPRRTGCIAVFS
jgi:hypothetical protein